MPSGNVCNNIAADDIPWTSASNAQYSDGSFATAVSNVFSQSHWLIASGFGFSIPTDAIISGVSVEFQIKASSQGTPSVSAIAYNGQGACLVKAGTPTGLLKNVYDLQWPTSGLSRTVGSSTDLWGATLVPSDVNANNFGVALTVLFSGGGLVTAFVDQITLTVYYTGGQSSSTNTTPTTTTTALGTTTLTATSTTTSTTYSTSTLTVTVHVVTTTITSYVSTVTVVVTVSATTTNTTTTTVYTTV
jgi:hypothetical protein